MAEMVSRIERYRSCAITCAQTHYASVESVCEHNLAANEMRRLAGDSTAVEELSPLLDDPIARRWLAFHLVEFHSLDEEVERRCLRIIGELAAGKGAEGLGAKSWLQGHGYLPLHPAPDGV